VFFDCATVLLPGVVCTVVLFVKGTFGSTVGGFFIYFLTVVTGFGFYSFCYGLDLVIEYYG
jgi:hypothetical protein